MPHQIKTLTVLGTGVLGSQIAYQAAFHGFAVTAYDVDGDALEKARARFARLVGIYRAANVGGAGESKAEAALENLRLTANLGDAVADADLVIEAVPELLEVKRVEAVNTARSQIWPPPRPSSPRTHQLCCPVILKIPPAAPTASSPSITPTTSGRRTSPR